MNQLVRIKFLPVCFRKSLKYLFSLKNMFTRFIVNGDLEVSGSWKVGNISSPIFKNGKTTDPSNYRTVKVMETFVR